MVFNTHVPVPMRSMFATPNIALLNIMACRVYRNTKFGLFREEELSTANMNKAETESKLPPFPVFAHRSAITTTDSTDSPYTASSRTTRGIGAISVVNMPEPAGSKLGQIKEYSTSTLGGVEPSFEEK